MAPVRETMDFIQYHIGDGRSRSYLDFLQYSRLLIHDEVMSAIDVPALHQQVSILESGRGKVHQTVSHLKFTEIIVSCQFQMRYIIHVMELL